MRVSDGFRSFVLGQLEAVGGLVPRSMFGGVGLYADGLFFGIIAGDVLYLKADDFTRPEFERAGAEPFRPYADRAGTMKYYAVPVGVLESEAELLQWAQKAIEAAERSGAEPPPKKRRGARRSAPARDGRDRSRSHRRR
jgi:DNA transformation protein